MKKIYVTCFSLFLFLIVPAAVYAATLSVSPSSGTFSVGDTITVRVLVSSDASLNAISGDIMFPPSLFSIVSVSKNSSILNFWVTDPTFSAGTGILHFEGVALNGFSGNGGVVVTVTVRVLKSGTGHVSFQTGKVLADDGQGTDITGSLLGADFTLNEAVVNPPSTPASTSAQPVQVETPTPPPTLTAPAIVLGSKYGAQAIDGSSNYPNAQVLLTFMSSDGTKIFITGTADDTGSFTLLVPHALKRGSYTITAVMIKDDGTHSVISNVLTVSIGNIFSDLGWQTELFILLLIIALIYLVARIFFHMRKNKGVRHEVREAEKVLHKSFDILRQDIEDHSFGKNNADEHKQIREIKKDIDDAEDVIDKEIKDIDI